MNTVKMTMDPTDAARVQRELRSFDRDTNRALRAESKLLSVALAAKINEAASRTPDRIARDFTAVGAARAKSDRWVAVDVSPRRLRVTGSPFALMNATEYGSDLPQFKAAKGGRYWIGPTVERGAPAIVAAWTRTVDELAALADRGAL